MSKKEAVTEQMQSVLDSALQDEDRVKCENILLLTTKIILDLPIELQEHILVEAIIAEVRDRMLLRDGWTKSADRIVERLRNVCPQWNQALATDGFRKRLHGIINSFPMVKYSFEILARDEFSNCVNAAALNNEVFLLCHNPQQHAHIDIYGRNNLRTTKGTIQLPDVTIPFNLVACSTTNCLYILHQASSSIQICRVLIDDQVYQVSPWIMCSTKLISRMSVAADGSVVLFQGPAPSTIRVYNADGSLRHEMELANRICYLHDIVSKSDGSFVLVKKNSLTQVDREGNTLYEGSKASHDFIYTAISLYDRMVAIDECGSVQLFDSEFNSVKVKFELKSYNPNRLHFYRVHYNRKRNEFIAFESAAFCDRDGEQCLTIFSLKERNIPMKDAQN